VRTGGDMVRPHRWARRYRRIGRRWIVARPTRRPCIDQLIFLVQMGQNRHEAIMESLRRFGEHVILQFQTEAVV